MKKKVICAAMAAMMIATMAANVYAGSEVSSIPSDGMVYAQQDEGDEPMVIAPAPSADDEIMVISETPENYKIVINGKTLDLGSQKLFAEKDAKGNTVLMVPLRAISEALGFKVAWKDRSAFVDDGQMHTTITIGKDEYSATTSVEGLAGATGLFSLGAAPQIVDNRTYVPLQIFEILMGNVEGMFKLDGTTVTIDTKAGDGDNTQIPDPFVEYSTIAEAAAASGIQFIVPANIPEGYSRDTVSAIKGELIQASYTAGSDKSAEILFKKGVGKDDVSGDYNTYKETATEKIGSVSVTLKGSDGKVNVATWTDGNHSYAIDINGAGLAKSAVTELVKGLK